MAMTGGAKPIPDFQESRWGSFPNSIKVGPYRYNVRVDAAAIAEVRYEHSAPGATGECHPKNLTITLDPAAASALQRHDLLHEVYHAVHWAVGLNSDDKVTVHDFMNRTLPTLLAALRDNPGLVWLLMEEEG